MAKSSLYAVLIVIAQCLYDGACMDYDGWLNVKIEHTLNCQGESFCPRGRITLKSLRSGSPIIEQNQWSPKDMEELKLLAQEDGFYTMRFSADSVENKETVYMSSVKAEALLESDLNDIINVWVLPTGSVIAINCQVNNSTKKGKQDKETGYSITSKFHLHHIEQAPVPDTASFIQKLEREREAREKGDLKDNRSFLAKYWMYIVPIALFFIISGATSPDADPPGR